MVVYRPVFPFRSSMLKYPVYCPESVLMVAATPVVQIRCTRGAIAERLAMLTVVVLPVDALIQRLFMTYPVYV